MAGNADDKQVSRVPTNESVKHGQIIEEDVAINASGHKQELERYGHEALPLIDKAHECMQQL